MMKQFWNWTVFVEFHTWTVIQVGHLGRVEKFVLFLLNFKEITVKTINDNK